MMGDNLRYAVGAAAVIASSPPPRNRTSSLYELFMAGAFLDNPDEPLTSMGILRSREDAEEFAKGDPFVVNGMVINWYIREWANILA
jgi:uncharacterized protein YciI